MEMNKRVKKFFKRNKPQPRQDFCVDICSVNVVSEAEKIIEEYVNKMGYRIGPAKKHKKRVFAVIGFATAAALIFAAAKVFLV